MKFYLNSKKRILFVHPIFSVYGGAEKLMLDLFRRTKKEFESKMYTLFYADCLKKETDVHWATKKIPFLSDIFGFKTNPFSYVYIKKLAKMIAEDYKKDDIIFITNVPASLILYEAVKINPKIKNGKNIFLSFEPDRILYHKEIKKAGCLPEDLDTLKFKLSSPLFFNWRRKDYFAVENYIREVFTLSDYVTEQTKVVYKNKKVRKATEMYVDLDNFKIKSKSDSRERIEKHFKLGLKSSDVIILSQSRIEKSKGILELVEAIKKINEEGGYENLKLLIGGRGNLMDELKKETKNMKNVYILGFIPNELLHHLYGAADIFAALPKKETGGPLTILEGMYAQAIVISSNEGGPPELIRNGVTGYLVDSNNIKDISEKIKKAYLMKTKNNNEYKRITRLSKEEVVKKFSFESFYKILISNILKV